MQIRVNGWQVEDESGEVVAVCHSRRHAVLLAHAEELISYLVPLAVCDDGGHGDEVRELFDAIDRDAQAGQGESLTERVNWLRDALPVEQQSARVLRFL